LDLARIICFDIETTGFEYSKGEKIIEIGAVEILNSALSGKTFHEYINPERPIPIESYNIHKISSAFVADKPTFVEIAQKFLDFVSTDSLIVAHNGKGFDFPFINHQLEEIGLPKIAPDRQEDTMLMAQRKIADLKSYSLDALAKYFNISLETREGGHGALIDTEILAKIYLELAQKSDEKTVAEIAQEQHAAFLADPKSDGTFPRRQFPPSAEELAIHTEWFEKNIKKS